MDSIFADKEPQHISLVLETWLNIFINDKKIVSL